MTVTLSDDGVIRLEGVCSIEDAEVLLQRLSDDPAASIDWSHCDQAHTAVVQVLLAARPKMVGTPRAAFLRDYVGGLGSALKSDG